MRVQVLFFGVLKDMAGGGSEFLDLPEQARVSDLLARFRDRPGLAALLPSVAISVNREYAAADLPLHDQDEIALLPPVSGGADAAARAALVHGPIDAGRIIAATHQPADGAVVVFQGIVRGQSRGRRTSFLEYEAYEAMAAKELETLANQALTTYGIREVALVHRLGRLEIGETSVLIVVAAAHRAPAFEACRWLIDRLKQTVPIWKKEHFAGGAVWAPGEPFPPALMAPPASSVSGGGR
jgi:molybdopterin synthase catalytic subunit